MAAERHFPIRHHKHFARSDWRTATAHSDKNKWKPLWLIAAFKCLFIRQKPIWENYAWYMVKIWLHLTLLHRSTYSRCTILSTQYSILVPVPSEWHFEQFLLECVCGRRHSNVVRISHSWAAGADCSSTLICIVRGSPECPRAEQVV